MAFAKIILIFFTSLAPSDIEISFYPEKFDTPMACEEMGEQISKSLVQEMEKLSKEQSPNGIGYQANVSFKCEVVSGSDKQPIAN